MQTVSDTVRFAKATVTLPMTHVNAAAICESTGLVSQQNDPKLINQYLALMANGVMNLVPSRSFCGDHEELPQQAY